MPKRAFVWLFGIAIGLVPQVPARATEEYPPYVLSESRACHNGCSIDQSGLRMPGPAVTGLSRLYADPGFSFSAEGSSSLIHGEFQGYVRSGGFSTIYPDGSNNAASGGSGQLFDTLVVTGAGGVAQFHLPLRIAGAAIVQWTAPQNYMPPFPPGRATFFWVCAVGDAANLAQDIPCDDPEIIWEFSALVDEVHELVWTFTFGNETLIDLRPSLSANFGPTASPSGGQVNGVTEATITATFEPAYVTDLQGNPIGNVAVTSESGWDYLTAVPEPGATTAGAVAAACLGALSMRRRVATPCRASSSSCSRSR